MCNYSKYPSITTSNVIASSVICNVASLCTLDMVTFDFYYTCADDKTIKYYISDSLSVLSFPTQTSTTPVVYSITFTPTLTEVGSRTITAYAYFYLGSI